MVLVQLVIRRGKQGVFVPHQIQTADLKQQYIKISITTKLKVREPRPVTSKDAQPPGIQTVVGSNLRYGKTYFRRDLGHEIISTAIPSLQLIQVGQLSVGGDMMCTK